MCFGGGASQPSAPEVKYVGPSAADIQRNEQQLATYQQQMADQQAAFQSQLQMQIDAANADYADLENTYANELKGAKSAAAGALSSAQKAAAGDLASAAAGAALVQSGAYKVGTQQSEPVNAQQTKAIKDKKKPKSSLKINTGGTQASAGAGLNIGV